jgi:hypothetical protein
MFLAASAKRPVGQGFLLETMLECGTAALGSLFSVAIPHPVILQSERAKQNWYPKE